MNSSHYNASELITTLGVLGQFEYVINIQKRFNVHAQDKLSFAVGVLVNVQFVLSACSIFYEAVNKEIAPEEKKYKDLRVVADGVNGHQSFSLDGRKIRFIDRVTLHPKCRKPPSSGNKWLYDLAIARTSFPFDLRPGLVGQMKFGYVPGGADQLRKNRTQSLDEFREQHMSVSSLAGASVCRIMSWGRREKVTDPVTGNSTLFYASPRLLLYKIKLASDEDCETFCSEDDRFCSLGNHTEYPVICAFRGNVTFVYEGKDYSAYPCAGTEGSPLVCHPPGKPEKEDIYGIVSNIPPTACVNRQWPVTITNIDAVSRFVVDVTGEAATVRAKRVDLLLFPLILSSQYIDRI